jgi:2-iminobutanoate/2-iminopropanoate deaminase
MQHFDLDGDPTGFPYSQGVRSGGFLFVAGQLAADDPDFVAGSGGIEAETRRALERIGRVLARAGAGFQDVVRVGVFMTDLADFDRMNAVFREFFPSGALPARTCVGVAALLGGGLIEIDCIARCPPGERP